MSNDLFDAQVEVVAERKVRELLNDKDFAIKYLLDHVKELEAQNEAYAPKAEKWDQFLDADGYLDAAECADHIKVLYFPPHGSRARSMGRNHFLQMLTHDGVIVSGGSGYRIGSRYRDALEGFAKIFTKPIASTGRNQSSVKFNSKGLNWLHDKYASDKRVWHSTTEKELYYE